MNRALSLAGLLAVLLVAFIVGLCSGCATVPGHMAEGALMRGYDATARLNVKQQTQAQWQFKPDRFSYYVDMRY
jgi:uncharacterized protein YceK